MELQEYGGAILVYGLINVTMAKIPFSSANHQIDVEYAHMCECVCACVCEGRVTPLR